MLTASHRISRRHRRTLIGLLVLITLASAGAAVHTAAMADDAHGHQVSDAVLTCIVVGGSMAVAVGTAFALRRVPQRPLWRLVQLPAPGDAVRLTVPRWLVRAGPPAQLQVFRL